jgi:hypothetical protein
MSSYKYGPFWITISCNEVQSTRDEYLGPYTYYYRIDCDLFPHGESDDHYGKFISVQHALDHAKNELGIICTETLEEIEA